MKQSKTLDFLKKNAVYLILALCIVAIGLTVTLVLIDREENIFNDSSIVDQLPDDTQTDGDGGNNDIPSSDLENPDDLNNPVDVKVNFIVPVENATSITEYSEQMVFNSTLNRFSAHLAIDFFAPENSKVFAVYDGTVESITTSLLTGTTITIDHGNGLKTVYNSLSSDVAVQEGQKVSQGDQIGLVSLTNRQEYKSGAHLHFEALENGKNIDPAKYLEISEK